jgi:hypothetical protein
LPEVSLVHSIIGGEAFALGVISAPIEIALKIALLLLLFAARAFLGRHLRG